VHGRREGEDGQGEEEGKLGWRHCYQLASCSFRWCAI
jgi:hypothetical protein